jgi:hypothetical protein
MAVLTIPNLPNQSYIRLIEEQAHFYLPIKQVKFKHYVNAEELCKLYDTPPHELFNFVQESESIHGVMCESGAFFVHPSGLTKHLRKWGLHAMKAKKVLNPFTKKEVLLC